MSFAVQILYSAVLFFESYKLFIGLQILKKVRPAVCGISDKTQRARVVDALMASISSPGVMGDIQRASQSSAMRAADSARKTSYEKMCEESQSAYYARNPHKTQKEGM